MLKIEIPDVDPQGKGRPRHRAAITKSGRSFAMVYTPTATRQYENMLRQYAGLAMRGKPPLDGALVVVVRAYFAVPKSWPLRRRDAALVGTLFHTVKPDGDNIFKSVADAFNAVVWSDDSQIVDGRVIKTYSERPGLLIEITPVESALTAVTGQVAAIGA